MGILDQGIDWSAVEVGGGMTDNNPVPPGEYTVEAIKYEEKTSKAGNVFLAFEFKILGPSHANMRLWENFVITGSSNVGKARLKKLRFLCRWRCESGSRVRPCELCYEHAGQCCD
jgi:hypothetical protein